MTFDPVNLGEYTQHSYAKYLIGGNQDGFQGLLNEFASKKDSDLEKEFIRSKGPYIQGVPTAKWSDRPWGDFARDVDTEFAPTGIAEPIIQAFEEEGFESLQVHQEEAIDWLSDDNHGLISAGTGRGKTEAWFIPILQYALRAKRGKMEGVQPESIKAVITYPTKALAQDQLKRFMEYLWFVNEKSDLPEGQQLTIGVYDGDTPRRGINKDGKDTHKYLEDAFKYFELPKEIAKRKVSDPEKLSDSSPRLNVKKEGQEYFLQTRQAYGGDKIDFVHLTRDKIHESPPDILLTNPDTINYRLFNINDEQSHRLFIDQPKFLVFDEVHTYDGVFGAHVSMLVKRLRRLREERNVSDTLRLIASSATVDEREELFQRLFNIPTGGGYKIIEEETTNEIDEDLGSIPSYLKLRPMDASKLKNDLERLINGNKPEEYEDLKELPIDPSEEEDQESLIKRLTDTDLRCVDHLHRVLQQPHREEYTISDSPKLQDFSDYIATTYNLANNDAEIVAQNVLTLFEIGGYETRIHLFNWPIDGYYKCVHCQSIYAKPQSCDCGGEDSPVSFVTKIRICKGCGEQVYEAWYCPDCNDVRPVTQETEGEYLYATKPECNHAQHDELVRIYWNPEYQCEGCGKREITKDSLGECRKCGSELTRTSEGVVCKNPVCQEVYEDQEITCSDCGGNLSVEEDLDVQCSNPDCSDHSVSSEGLDCDECESNLIPKLKLSWVCTNEDHSQRQPPGEIPDKCECGRSTFVLPAYVDTQQADSCAICNEDRSDVYHLPGTGCAVEGHEGSVERIHKSFGLKAPYLDSSGNVRLASPSHASHALPCYHGRYRDYEHLMRAPSNTAVTMSQFMLRKLADDNEGDQSMSKLISFSDSYRDMERLANDFDEPERLLFIQQRMLYHMEEVKECSLEDLIEETAEGAREYWDNLDTSDDIISDIIGFTAWKGTISGQLIGGSYKVFRGVYEQTYGQMVSNGLLNISIDGKISGDEENAVCEVLLGNNRIQQEYLLQELRDKHSIENPFEAIDNLEEKGIIEVGDDYDRVSYNNGRIKVHFVGSEDPIDYSTEYDTFVSEAEKQVSGEWEDAVPFEISYRERAQLSSPYFDRTCFWASQTSPRMLLSEVYKGDLKATERRKIEHEFKRGSTPNFLSTGPAMEIGIDIGDLNTLMLLGTPPNTNAYLQRIGRAGRDAGKSLVTTVSKRNPIDFYYHKKPSEIIKSDEKPVPLNQHNEYVMEASLTWAVMDYIAANYYIPWEREELIEGGSYTLPDPNEWNRYSIEDPQENPPHDYETFTRLYHSNVEEVHLGKSFAILNKIVEEDSGVREWLKSILDYSFCKNCGHVYQSSVRGTCDNCEEAELLVAKQEFQGIIENVLEEFQERMVSFAYDHLKRLEEDKERLREEIRDLEEARSGSKFSGGFDDFSAEEDQEQREHEARLGRLKDQLNIVEKLINQYEESKLSSIHSSSQVSEYTPQLRTFSDSVSVQRHEKVSEHSTETRPKEESNWSRNAGMALRELHPYGYTLRNKRGYVVTRVHEDSEGTKELQEELGVRLLCEECGGDFEWNNQDKCPNSECDAGASSLHKTEPLAISKVELSDRERQFQGTSAEDIYPLSGYQTKPRGTFGQVDTETPNFEAENRIKIVDSEGTALFTIEQGEIDIIEKVSKFTTTYDDGTQDPKEQPITLCREQHCNSVVIQNNDKSMVCLRDPTHNQSKQNHVIIGRTFSTEGLKISADPNGPLSEEVVHTLAHGFRLALQRTGGVGIRDIQENYNGDSYEAYIFESNVGGNGVTRLLFNQENGEYIELEEALEIMHENVGGCDCNGGCPECIYQYGCDQHNKETQLDKRRFIESMEDVVGEELSEKISADQ